jgi:transposase
MILAVHRRQIRSQLAKKNDLTLKELRQAVGLQCSLQAIHVVLAKMELTYKKRHSAPTSKTGLTSRERAGSGASASPV